MSSEQPSKDQIKVKFFTRDEDENLHVASNPIYVPASLRRFGLSEIVNHLLESETPVPFEFLVEGTLLKGTLQDYLVQNGLSTEAFLTLEYTRAVLPPKFLSSFSNEDWISSIHTMGSMTFNAAEGDVTTNPKIVTGSYDGVVRIWNESGKVETQLEGHSQPIKAVKFITPTRFVSAGMDRSIRLWKAGTISNEDIDKDTQKGKTLALLEVHNAPVSSLDVHTETNKILSGSYDNTLALWSTNPKDMETTTGNEDESERLSSASRKRLKLAHRDATLKRKSPLSILESHKSPVEDVLIDKTDASVAYSVSQDHTIKTWDLVTSRCVDTKQTNYSLLSLAKLDTLGLLATGSSARHINLHDPRASKVTNSQLVGHTNMVVSLTTTDNDYMLISGSHDGTAKVWDVRADKAMYTITRESGNKSKVFAVDWEKEIGILSAGSDKKLQINSSAELK
ncbi:Ytm1 protein [Martiniozyma asiatica (nom. inval.)]|nr:Ytm1 protein [Martiniozyma asiatica]